LTNATLESLEGQVGNFTARVHREPRFINEDLCTACGDCTMYCPVFVSDGYNEGLSITRAPHKDYPQAVPTSFYIDAKMCLFLNHETCQICVPTCQAKAIDFSQKEERLDLSVGAVILSPGFGRIHDDVLARYGYGRFPDVVTSLEFERIMCASGPSMGEVIRPSDGKHPKRVAFLQCVGSRDINTGNGYCSSVCCMYAVKGATIVKEHAPDTDICIFYMDMRTYGKEFEKYYQRAEQEKGVRFVRSRVHSVERVPGTDDLSLRYATEAGEVVRETFDMVVLSVGMRMAESTVNLAKRLDVHLDGYQFAETSSFAPARTSRSGVYVCGAFREPKDIPGSVMEASAAACAASQALAGVRHTKTLSKMLPHETHVLRQETRVGVFVCNCGINIGGIADVPAVTAYAATLPRVVHAEENLFTCSQDTQERIRRVIHEKGINRVVVASCSPRTHEPLFRSTIREAGLNPFLIEMANIRDQNTWVHQSQPEEATVKAKDLVRMAVAKVALTKPLYPKHVPVTKSALVVGGGVAGMVSALSLAEQGFSACLVEKSESLGGQARNLSKTWKGESVVAYLEGLIDAVTRHPKVEVFLNTEVRSTSGTAGNFTTTLVSKGPELHSSKLTHGVAILATGGRPLSTSEYLYGQNPNVLCWFDLDRLTAAAPERVKNAQAAVFIQCVGSRDSVRPYCSKICCTHAVTSALQLKEMNPEMDVFILYRDIRTYGAR
jgi:heterodisulfide reductase subunit A